MKNSDKPVHPDNWDATLHGLTKREYFAAMALQGLASRQGSPAFEHEAEQAVKYADALLKQLESKNDKQD